MNTKRMLMVVGGLALATAAILWFGTYTKTGITPTLVSGTPTTPLGGTEDVVSTSGIHWHPELSIIIKGQKQAIPANIGIGMQYAGYKYYDSMMMMADMHTHDVSGQIHWEVMQGPVTKDEVTLSAFFGIWGKTFSNSCIFEYCNGAEGTVKMLVNGKENTEFEKYLVKDNDKIEISYE